MENLYIKEEKCTPEISLNLDGTISLVGRSYPENTLEFYKPMMEWLEKYFELPLSHKTIFNMEIIYFNSSSSKLFFDLFDLLEEYSNNNDIEINWIYDEENDNAEEAGEYFIEDFENLNINLIVKEELNCENE